MYNYSNICVDKRFTLGAAVLSSAYMEQYSLCASPAHHESENSQSSHDFLQSSCTQPDNHRSQTRAQMRRITYYITFPCTVHTSAESALDQTRGDISSWSDAGYSPCIDKCSLIGDSVTTIDRFCCSFIRAEKVHFLL